MMRKERFLMNMECIIRTTHGFIGRLSLDWKRNGLKSTSWSTVWTEERGEGIWIPEWYMFTEKALVRSRDVHIDHNSQIAALLSESSTFGLAKQTVDTKIIDKKTNTNALKSLAFTLFL